MSKEYFDVILFSPLDTEIEAVFESFPNLERRTSGNILKFTVDLGVSGLKGLVAQPPDWGNQEALKAAQQLFQDYDAGLVVCIGIAGTLSTDLKLGDICYSGTIFDVHERLKVKDTKSRRSGGLLLEHNPKPFTTPRPVTVAFNHLRGDPELRAKFYASWQERQAKQLDDLISSARLGSAHRSLFPQCPSAIPGALICGPVVASLNYREVLKGLDRKVLAVETESGGLFQAAQDAGISALVVRGISDPADPNKNDLEEETEGVARQIASRNAATYFREQLKNPEFLTYLRSESDRRAAGSKSVLAASAERSPVIRVLDAISDEIELKLKELCPEFPLTRKGYRLPSPRVKAIRLEDDPRSAQDNDLINMADAIASSQVTFVDIPRNYPDLALPWVWADVLSVVTIGNNQILPMVIDGNNLRPPLSTIERAMPAAATQILAMEGIEPVFIINNVNTSSRSRVNHLATEVKKYPKARFVLITKGEGALLLQREILRKIGGRPYGLGDISFLAISEFIQAAFEVAPSEAEVIALKIKETFSKFKLSAHPTYFAGIPQPMISGLLQANRRAELIQVAVDGYLTIIAAQDQEATHLNRSTRARYLARLAVGLDVEKLTYSEAELIEFTKQFAGEYDFDDLDPLPFINSFVQKGILRFKDDRVEFTLPFVRSYLLASALRDDPALAKRYFDFSAEDFDFETFDLYSELGASSEIIAAVEDRLRRNIETLQSIDDGSEFLLSNKLRPALLDKSDRLGEIRLNIQRAISRLQDKSDDGRGKQKLLDIADNATTEVEQRAGDDRNVVKREALASSAELDRLLRDWRFANVLLGAAAQRLPGPTKQKLAALLVKGGAAIADRLTRLYASVDFKEIKTRTLNSAEVEAFLSNYSTGMDKEQLKQLVGYVIDFVELYILALPFRAIITDLCDQSGDKVLSGSVDRAVVAEGLAALMHAAWLADLDSTRAAPRLRKQLGHMPLAPFLRIILVQHFLNRVYWRHWDDADRARLLQAAQDVMKAFGTAMNKGPLERWIGKSSETDREE